MKGKKTHTHANSKKTKQKLGFAERRDLIFWVRKEGEKNGGH